MRGSNDHDLRIAAMFDRIASRYDLLNRALSLGSDVAWRRRALELARPPAQGTVLDVGTGTGDFALALLARSPSATVVGVDISAGMLAVAERRALRTPAERRFRRVRASVERLPFADAVFDRVTAGFVLRNVADVPRALREMRRVLRQDGRAVILDLHTPDNPAMHRLWSAYTRLAPRLAAVVGSDPDAYRYLPRSIEAHYDPAALAALLNEAGFRRSRFERLTFGVAAIHVGEA